MEVKIFNRKLGKVCKLNVELEVYIDDVNEFNGNDENSSNITNEDVKTFIENLDSGNIGEMVLNNLHNAKIEYD